MKEDKKTTSFGLELFKLLFVMLILLIILYVIKIFLL